MSDETSPHDQTALMVAIEVRAGLARHEGECGERWRGFKDTMDRFWLSRRERDKDIDEKFTAIETAAAKAVNTAETRLEARLQRWEKTITRLAIAIVASGIGHLLIFMISNYA